MLNWEATFDDFTMSDFTDVIEFCGAPEDVVQYLLAMFDHIMEILRPHPEPTSEPITEPQPESGWNCDRLEKNL